MQKALKVGAPWKAQRSRPSLAHESRWTHRRGLTAHTTPLRAFFSSLMPLNFVSSLQTSINDSEEDGLTTGKRVACWVVGLPRLLFWFWFHHKLQCNRFIHPSWSGWDFMFMEILCSVPNFQPLHLRSSETLYLPSVKCSAFLHPTPTAIHESCVIHNLSHQWGFVE